MGRGHDATAWCYVSGWVSVLETQLLGKDTYRTLLDSGDPETAWGVLSKTGYRSYFDGPKDLRHFEQAVRRFSKEQQAALRALCPERDLMAFFEFDQRYRTERARWMGPEGKEDREAGPSFTVEAFLRAFPEILFSEDDIASFRAALDGENRRGRSTYGMSSTERSTFLDALYLSLLLTWARQWPGTLIQEYVECYVGLKVAMVVLRGVEHRRDMGHLDRYLFLGPLRTALVAELLEREEYPDVSTLVETLLPDGLSMPGEVDSSLEAFQGAAERFLLETVWPARYVVFGPEKVFGYLCGLQNQEVNMRLCLSAVLYRLDPRRIAEQLRPTYV